MLLTILGLQLVIVGLLLAVLFIKPKNEVAYTATFETPPETPNRPKKYKRSGKYTKEAIAKRRAASARKRKLRRELKEAERVVKKLQ